MIYKSLRNQKPDQEMHMINNGISEGSKEFKKNEALLFKILELEKKFKGNCYYAVFGGFAVDAHYGQITRFHEDIDLICWRKDLDIVRALLRDMGYESKLFAHPKDKKLIYKLHTTDRNKTYSFQIADKINENHFEISFWPYPHLEFPIRYLRVQYKELYSNRFPVASKQLLIDLKKMQAKFYEKGKQESIEKYLLKQRKNHDKALHDIKLLDSGNKDDQGSSA